MLRITQKPKPLVLCILDGWGMAGDNPGNAVLASNPQNFNGLWSSYPHTYLTTTGQAVGLPEGVVGNSEVGHQNLGAGKIVLQDVARINLAIENGQFFENAALLAAANHAKTNNSNVHLVGLIGQGQVHSTASHLFALLALLRKQQIPPSRVKIHLFTDGRDSPPTSAKTYLSQVIKRLAEEDLGKIASISGRYFAMDRDNRWDRTAKAYFCLTGQAERWAQDSQQAIDESYTDGITDEFIEPTIIVDRNNQPIGQIKDDDAVIFFNYRPDRSRQLPKAFVLENFAKVKTASGETVATFNRGPKIPNLFSVTLTEYESGLPVSDIAFKSDIVTMPLARVFAQMNLRQLHIAETEKYAHVTYFFNGGQELPFPGEDRIVINSPKVTSYDQKPEMATPEITKQLIKRISARIYDFIVVNFANADMLGHTGNRQATMVGIKCIDEHLGILTKSALAAGGGVIITADHGNAEEMINLQTGGIDTEHNANPSPFIAVIDQLRGQNLQLSQGLLADVAPTVLSILNVPKPSQMTGHNLLA